MSWVCIIQNELGLYHTKLARSVWYKMSQVCIVQNEPDLYHTKWAGSVSYRMSRVYILKNELGQYHTKMSWALQNPQNDVHPHKDSSFSLMSPQCMMYAKDPKFLYACSEDWSDCVDVQAAPRLGCMHIFLGSLLCHSSDFKLLSWELQRLMNVFGNRHVQCCHC